MKKPCLSVLAAGLALAAAADGIFDSYLWSGAETSSFFAQYAYENGELVEYTNRADKVVDPVGLVKRDSAQEYPYQIVRRPTGMDIERWALLVRTEAAKNVRPAQYVADEYLAREYTGESIVVPGGNEGAGFAHWDRYLFVIPCFSWIKYGLVYERNHGEDDRETWRDDSSVHQSPEDVQLPPPPEDWNRAGYAFAGWGVSRMSAETFSTNTYTGIELGVQTNGEFRLYAHWKPFRVTLALDPNGGRVASNAVYAVGGMCPALPEPTKPLCTFVGWFGETNGLSYTEGMAVDAGDGETVNLVAEWISEEASVALDRQGGETGDVAVEIVFGADLPRAEMPTRTGYDFAGYFAQREGRGDKYYEADGTSKRPIARADNVKSLYAHWVAKKSVVTLDATGGAPGTGEVVAEYGEDLPDITPPKRRGYDFAGYYTFTTGGTCCYRENGAGVRWKKTSRATLYAQWKPHTYNVAYDYAGGDAGDYQPVKATYGLPFAVGVPRRDGYRFVGYRVSGDLDADAARYGAVIESVDAAVAPAADCRGAEGGPFVFFKDLCSTAGGTVLLTAQWTRATMTAKRRVATTPRLLAVAPSGVLGNGAALGPYSEAADCNFELTATNLVENNEWQVIATNAAARGASTLGFSYSAGGYYSNVTNQGWISGSVTGLGTLTFQWRADIGLANPENGSKGFVFGYSSGGAFTDIQDHPDTNWTTVTVPITCTGATEFKWSATEYMYTTGGTGGAGGSILAPKRYTVWLDDIHWEAPFEPPTLVVAAPDPVDCVYDGEGHGLFDWKPMVTTTGEVEVVGAKVRYGLCAEGPFAKTAPSFTNACATSVWYTVTAEGYVGVTNSVSIAIHPATNAWTVVPSVSATWQAGAAPAVVAGQTAFGEVAAYYHLQTNETQKINRLPDAQTPAGAYTAVFSVDGTANWSALATNINFTVTAPSGGEESSGGGEGGGGEGGDGEGGDGEGGGGEEPGGGGEPNPPAVVVLPEFSATAVSCEGQYDGQPHGIEVVYDQAGVGFATVKYALAKGGPYQTGGIAFVNATPAPVTVWFTVEAQGYAVVTNSGTVMIHKAANGWLSGPSISGWKVGDAPHGGVAKSEFGEVSVAYATNDVPCTAAFTVAEAANWLGLATNVTFTVEGLPPAPDGGGDSGEGEQGGGEQGGGEQGGDDSELDPDTDPDSDPDPELEPDEAPPDLFPNGLIGEFTAAAAATYSGWLRDAEGRLAGTLQVKTARAKNAGAAVRATISVTPLGARKKTYRTMVAPGANATDEYGVVYGDYGLMGTFDGCTVEASRDFAKSRAREDKAVAAAMPQGTWTMAFETPEGTAAFSLTLSKNGKAKFAGSTPAGAALTASGQGVVGEGGVFAVPFASAKKGQAIGFVVWIGASGEGAASDFSDARWRCAACAPYAPLPDGDYTVAAELPDGRGYLVAADGFGLTPDGARVSVAGGKASVPRAVGRVKYDRASGEVHVAYGASQTPANLAALKLTLTPRTGVVKGSFKLYYLEGARLKTEKATVGGIVVGSQFVGSARVKGGGAFAFRLQ